MNAAISDFARIHLDVSLSNTDPRVKEHSITDPFYYEDIEYTYVCRNQKGHTSGDTLEPKWCIVRLRDGRWAWINGPGPSEIARRPHDIYAMVWVSDSFRGLLTWDLSKEEWDNSGLTQILMLGCPDEKNVR